MYLYNHQNKRTAIFKLVSVFLPDSFRFVGIAANKQRTEWIEHEILTNALKNVYFDFIKATTILLGSLYYAKYKVLDN